ncbi:KH domain-containing protein [bacterium]|nr:KH domain-containing protein [bacterium]
MKDSFNYKEPLEKIITVLVDNPKEVEIREEVDGTIVNLYIKANPNDYGVIIGRGGKMINNIKNILKVKAVKDGIKINLNIDDREPESSTADNKE